MTRAWPSGTAVGTSQLHVLVSTKQPWAFFALLLWSPQPGTDSPKAAYFFLLCQEQLEKELQQLSEELDNDIRNLEHQQLIRKVSLLFSYLFPPPLASPRHAFLRWPGLRTNNLQCGLQISPKYC